MRRKVVDIARLDRARRRGGIEGQGERKKGPENRDGKAWLKGKKRISRRTTRSNAKGI